MEIEVFADVASMSEAAANRGADAIRRAIADRGEANIIVATGASQLSMLAKLADARDIDWQRVTGFHLDEYIGLPFSHSASFRQYLWIHFLRKLSLPMKRFHYLSGEGDAAAECERVGAILDKHPIDVAFVGIGENAHLAFNDPPADFTTDVSYLCVELDEACRQQQLGEGWFPTLEDVPTHAISMSIRRILRSETIICTVPDERKASAIQKSLEGPVTPEAPASVLQEHAKTTVFLDAAAASLLQDRGQQVV